uniref:Uncharacterized protein n=1 Tax=Molossus molossus TaxID=27622 RepID=A0A7J8HC25_MOLMO|nr:hypothetical protein HJG59_011180 [Molossus molossus]
MPLNRTSPSGSGRRLLTWETGGFPSVLKLVPICFHLALSGASGTFGCVWHFWVQETRWVSIWHFRVRLALSGASVLKLVFCVLTAVVCLFVFRVLCCSNCFAFGWDKDRQRPVPPLNAFLLTFLTFPGDPKATEHQPILGSSGPSVNWSGQHSELISHPKGLLT